MDLKTRIELLQTETKLSVIDIARICGITASAVRQWLGQADPPTQRIGSLKAALKLQDATGFHALWLAEGEGPRKVPTVPAPKTAEVIRIEPEWPFELVPRDRYFGLPPGERFVAQDAMLTKIEELEQRRKRDSA